MKVEAHEIRSDQKAIIALLSELNKLGVSVVTKERIFGINQGEIVISCTDGKNIQRDFTGYGEISKSRKDSMISAETNALCMACSFFGVSLSFDAPKPQPKKIINWNNQVVMSYKPKGVDVLLLDMQDSGVDIEPILAHKNKMPENSRLTVNEIARVFFPTGAGVSVVSEPKNSDTSSKTTHKQEKLTDQRQDFIDVLTKLNQHGWSEAKFVDSDLKTDYKSLMDFAKFAPQDLIDSVIKNVV